MPSRIQLRRGTAQEWSNANPVLALAEMGVETDTQQFKLGDGQTPWNSLNYGGMGGPSGPSGPAGPFNRYVETLLDFDTDLYYPTMSSGVGNVAIKNNLHLTYVASTKVLTSPLMNVSSGTPSTLTTNGALTVAGGAGIVGNLNVGGNVKLSNTLEVGDDVSVGGQLYVDWNNGQAGPAILPGRSGTLRSNTYDIGSSSGKFRDLYLGRNASIGGNANITYTLEVGDDVSIGGQLYVDWNNGQAGPAILPGTSGSLRSNTYDIGSTSGKFRDLYLGRNAYIGGDLHVQGEQFVITSNTIATGDKVINLSTGSTVAASAIDSGIAVGPISGSYASFLYDGSNKWKTGVGLHITDTSASVSQTTGALIVDGGAGFWGTVNADSVVANSLTGTLQTAAQTNITSVGTLGSLSVSGQVHITDTTVSTSRTTGALVVDGGAGFGKTIYVNGNVNGTNGNFYSLGVGTYASGTTGEIRATNEITAYYSDRRLKTNVKLIEGALDKVQSLKGITYTPNKLAASFGYDINAKIVGLFADEVEAVLPEAVRPAPFDQDRDGKSISGENYKTVQYEKLVPLLIEAVKELSAEVAELKTIIKSAGLN